MSSQIPLGKIDEGIKKSIENANGYFEDALFLYKNKRYQSSILLSMLSYEEFGKALLLMDYKSKEKEIPVYRLWVIQSFYRGNEKLNPYNN